MYTQKAARRARKKVPSGLCLIDKAAEHLNILCMLRIPMGKSVLSNVSMNNVNSLIFINTGFAG